jgi:hypothetical protein
MQIPRPVPFTFTYETQDSVLVKRYPDRTPQHLLALAGLPADPLLKGSPNGQLRGVKILFPAFQSSVLDTLRLRILLEVGEGTPASDAFLLYDTGVLEDGVDVELDGSNTVAIWLDNLGDDGPMFGGQIRLELTPSTTGAPGNPDDVNVVLDIVEFVP